MNTNKPNNGLKRLYKLLFFILLLMITLNCLILALEIKKKGYLDRTDYGAAIFFLLLPSFFFLRLRWLEKSGFTVERLAQETAFKDLRALLMGKWYYLALFILVVLFALFILIRVIGAI